jgi:5-methylcytosine-specific restriction endonuclease McrA
MAGNRRAIVLGIVATDRTFESATLQGQACWVGKCIHCQTRLTVGADGETGPGVTIEHIVARNHGGTDALENLALACARCNAQKGYRHDHRRRDDPKLMSLIETLKARRMARFVPLRPPADDTMCHPRSADQGPDGARPKRRRGKRG